MKEKTRKKEKRKKKKERKQQKTKVRERDYETGLDEGPLLVPESQWAISLGRGIWL